ncbi:PTS system, cellobiose-specific IIA component [Enterococcus sp. AZ194]|uniref:PTS lactose/cellobiose transporter subunit IIA n=1 Tax=Enterococcus sp. AZ194 TaxID=2774629 RepID=UPI003F2989A4
MTVDEISFELISKAGTAFSMMVDSLNDARNYNFSEVERKQESAEKLMNEAHNLQTSLIVNEMNDEEVKTNVLLIHAQDTLMNTILMQTIVQEFVRVYKREEERS